MSHFSVLVVGNDVEGQLAPYHEFECTGVDDQYVQDIDRTEEARAEYEKDTATRYRDPEGVLHDPFTPEGNWDNRFWRELTKDETAQYGRTCEREMEDGTRLETTDWHDGKGYRTKAFAFPSEGWAEVEVPCTQVETFAEWTEGYYGTKVVPFGQQPNLVANDDDSNHKYGYILLNEDGSVAKIIDRTNPNRHWDWWKLGGRWHGYFKLKEKALGAAAAALGEPGLQRMDPDYEPPEEGWVDQCLKGDIDIEAMRDYEGGKAAERFDIFAEATAGCPAHLPWPEIQKRNLRPGTDEDGEPNIDYEAARNEYGAQPAVRALRSSGNEDARWFEPDEFLCGREEYIARARRSAISTFAVVKDGQWYEKGRMGWWAMVSDEKDQDVWNEQFAGLIDGLPDDTLLSVVDCHI
jgi:hypothetical protein